MRLNYSLIYFLTQIDKIDMCSPPIAFCVLSVWLRGPGDREVSGGYCNTPDKSADRAIRDYTNLYGKQCGLAARAEVARVCVVC
jgi:hypothetical protein